VEVRKLVDKYIKLSDLQQFPIRINHCDREHGKLDFVLGIETVFEYIDCLPKYECIEIKEIDSNEK
jgi:hypothetical protein